MRTLLLAALAIASSLQAQVALTSIADGQAGGKVAMDNQSHVQQTMDTDGNLWAAFSKGGLSMYMSSDDGITWSLADKAASSKVNARVSVAADPGCRLLHVGWDSPDTNSVNSILYQAFDTVTRKFVGTETTVVVGVSSSEGYRFQNIAVTAKGTVVMFANSLGTVTSPVSKWSAYMWIKPAGQNTFGAPVKINQKSSGLRLNCYVVDETVHCAYRTSGSSIMGHNVGYRAYDTEANQFVAGELRIGGKDAGDSLEISNGLSFAADDANNFYVVYGVGGPSPALTGEIKLAFAKPPYTTWTRQVVTQDPKITAQKDSFHYTVTHTAGSQMFVVYSKFADDNKILYSREMKDGAFAGTEQTLITTTSRNMVRMTGHRGPASRIGLNVLVLDDTSAIGREMLLLDGTKDPVFGRSGQVRYLGHRCSGNLAEAPRLGFDVPPTVGRALTIQISDAPASSPVFLALGPACLATPIDLNILGAAGCGLFIDVPVVFGGVTNANGQFSGSTVALPSATVPFRMQAGVGAVGANAAGLVTSRAVSVHL